MTPRPTLAHVALWTAALDDAAEFWRTYFDAEIGPVYESRNRPGFASRFVTLPASGLRIEVMTGPWVAPNAGEASGWAHVALSVGSTEAVDTFAQRLGRDGLLVSGPRWTGDGYYEAVVRMPDGTLVELVA